MVHDRVTWGGLRRVWLALALLTGLTFGVIGIVYLYGPQAGGLTFAMFVTFVLFAALASDRLRKRPLTPRSLP